MNLSREDVEIQSITVLETALKSAITDPINNVVKKSGSTFGNRVRDLAQTIKCLSSEELFVNCARNFAVDLYSFLAQGNLLDETFRVNIWSKVHQYSLNVSKKRLWIGLVNEETVSSDEFSSLFHFLCMRVIEGLMAIENKNIADKQCDEVTPPTTSPMTNQEQEVLRYVAGYVIFSLKKRYKLLTKSNVIATREASVATHQFLSSLDTKIEKDLQARSFLDFTRAWIEIKNRGGLVKVNHNMFLFIRRVENEVRTVLTLNFIKNYRGEDLRDVLFQKLSTSKLVGNGWVTLSINLGNESSNQILKNQILQKWIDIRVRSYVNCYVQIVKRMVNKLNGEQRKLSSKAEPALRKTLVK